MSKVLFVGLGGALGSICRYLVAILSEKGLPFNFPSGTFIVNIIGSLIIGFCWSYFDRIYISNEFRLFIFAGFLGGFTTFSTFTRETIQLFKVGEPYHAIGYVLISNIAGLAAVALGFYICFRYLR